MTNKKNIAILGGMIGVFIATALVSPALFADAHQKFGFGKNEAVKDAVEAGDYQAFQEATDGRQAGEVVDSTEKFSKLIEAHKLAEEGKYEEAGKIKEDLGFKAHQGKRGGKGGNPEAREAVEVGDYESFLEAVEGRRMADVIDSEEDFLKLVEAHELAEEGDYEEARKIKEDLGMTWGKGRGNGHHQ